VNNRRRAIQRAARRSLYWSTAWRVAEAAVTAELDAAGPGRPYTAAELLAEIMDGLPPEFDRAKLRRAIDALAGGRGTLRELIDDAPESILRPLPDHPGSIPLKKQIWPRSGAR